MIEEARGHAPSSCSARMRKVMVRKSSCSCLLLTSLLCSLPSVNRDSSVNGPLSAIEGLRDDQLLQAVHYHISARYHECIVYQTERYWIDTVGGRILEWKTRKDFL